MCVVMCSFIHRQAWLDYFSQDGSVVVAFWSAKLETERLDSQLKTVEPDSSSVLDPRLDVEQQRVGRDKLIEERDTMAMVSTEGLTTDTIPTDICSAGTTPTPGTTPTIETASTGTDTDRIVNPACTIAADHTSSAALVTPIVDMEVSGDAKPTVEGCKEDEREERGDGRVALLNGEQLLELLVRVSPVAAGSLTTVGMVRMETRMHACTHATRAHTHTPLSYMCMLCIHGN